MCVCLVYTPEVGTIQDTKKKDEEEEIDDDEDEGDAVGFCVRFIDVYKDEAGLRARRNLVRGVACLKQSFCLTTCSTKALQLPLREGKVFPGCTNQGTVLGPLTLPAVADEWSATVKAKKAIYGPHRAPVGGKVKGQGDQRRRLSGCRKLGNVQVINTNDPQVYFSQYPSQTNDDVVV